MSALDERIKALEERLKQEKAKKAKLEARKRATEAKAQRAAETRRKILVGSYVLEMIKREDKEVTKLKVGGTSFPSWLTRKDDRGLFGLPEIQPTSPSEGAADA